MIFILTDIMFSLQAETEPDEMNEEEVEATAPSLYPDLEGGNDDDFSGGDQEDEDEPLLSQPATAASSSPEVTPKETSAAASPVASSTPRLLAPSAPSPDRKSDDTDTASVKSTEL